ncbi:MAG: isoprenylcysteine carboxylmethyltransferase family protein [Betaproteobacteria bacterium]
MAEIFKLPYAIAFWVVFFLVFVREGRIVGQAFGEKSSTQDAGTFRALIVGSPLAMLAAVAASFLPWLPLPFPVASLALGTVMVIAGGVLRRYCFNALGKSFTGMVTVVPDQQIVQSGIYRFIRHPSYTAAFLMYTGLGLALGSWISVAILFFVHSYLYGRRVLAEERALVATLGEPYREYMTRTKRFVPLII